MINPITTETKEQYKKRFWFMKQLAEQNGDDFLVCSEEIAYAFLWELCERMQEELTDVNSLPNEQSFLLMFFIQNKLIWDDKLIILMGDWLYNMTYTIHGRSCRNCKCDYRCEVKLECLNNGYEQWEEIKDVYNK